METSSYYYFFITLNENRITKTQICHIKTCSYAKCRINCTIRVKTNYTVNRCSIILCEISGDNYLIIALYRHSIYYAIHTGTNSKRSINGTICIKSCQPTCSCTNYNFTVRLFEQCKGVAVKAKLIVQRTSRINTKQEITYDCCVIGINNPANK